MKLLGRICITIDTHETLDREDLEAALFEHAGYYVPTFWEWITIPFLGDFDYDTQWTNHVDRNGIPFFILTAEHDPTVQGRATYVFQSHELPRVRSPKSRQ